MFLAAAGLSYGLVLGLMPFLARSAIAKANARSSHTTPTPQGDCSDHRHGRYWRDGSADAENQ
jgi:hypothetical protein